MRCTQYVLALLFSFLLVGCKGGGTLEQGGGAGGGTGTTPVYTLTLDMQTADGSTTRQVSQDNPVTVIATLRRNNVVQANQLISFELSGNVGVLSPSEGTARTDENGQARISLLAGEVPGAGSITATYSIDGQSYSSAPFVFDARISDLSTASINVVLVNHNGDSTRQVSHFQPAIAEARLTIDNEPASFKLVNFNLGSLGILNPTNGSAMTDADGIARIDVLAGFEAGASQITASFTTESGAIINSAQYTFTTSGDTPIQGDMTAYTLNLSMRNDSGDSVNEVSQSQPVNVTAVVLDEFGQPVVNEVVSFTSSLGRIQPSFGTALTNANGEATVRLTAGTFAGAGNVSAQYQAVVGNLGFTTAGDEVISRYRLGLDIFDNSGNSTRLVSKGNQGNIRALLVYDDIPLSNQLITFTLSNQVGELIPSIGTAMTNDEGIAEIRLFAGSVPGAGMVTATYQADDEVVRSLSFVFESSGDQSAETDIIAQVVEVNTDNEARFVDFDNPRRVKITLTQGGLPSAFKLVTVEARFAGVINPTSGRVMTNSDGVAYVDLLVGFTEGAGEVRAFFTTDAGIVIESDAFTFESAGDGVVQGPSPDFSIDLQLISSVTNTTTSEISATSPGQVVARVLDINGQPVVNGVVSFSSTLGNLRPSTGTALTDATGEARLSIRSGTAEGAGIITAQYEGVSESIGFYTRGDEVDPNQINAAVDFRLLVNCPSDFRTIRDPSLCSESTSISAEQPGILFIEVTREGGTTPLEQALVSAVSTIGSISPRTGTAITDTNGIALLDFIAGRDVGAGEVSITAFNTTRTKAFEIGAVDVDVEVSSNLTADDVLSAGSTALISVDILRNGEPFMPPLNVEFSSGCVQAGLAFMDEVVTSIGGVARSTYRAAGCVGSDLITATVITGGNTVSGSVVVDVSASAIGSLEFVDVSAPVIALKGTGGANRTETSVVRFRLVDENGNPVAGHLVDFGLSTAVGGIDLSQSNGFTNLDGIVQTVVRSGTVPTPIRVIARSEQELGDSTIVITAPSDQLNVSTGLADQNSFSLSLSAFNVHALNFDGNEVDVTVYMADHFNNPVPDGTAVNFITEGGSIEPSCTTENGRCSVKWRSQNPRPFTDPGYANTIADKCHEGRPCPLGIVTLHNGDWVRDNPLGGRATILAYAVGEESFTDLNGNGRFDVGEFVTAYDIPEAFIDHNEDNLYAACRDFGNCAPQNQGDAFEEFIDFNGDGVWDDVNGRYNGLLCSFEDEAAGDCTRDLVHVFQNRVVVMSGDAAFFRLVTYASDCDAIPGVTASAVRVTSNNTSDFVREVQGDPTSRLMCDVSAVDLSDGEASSVLLRLFIADVYNNPLPVGTTVTISTDNGILVGTDSFTFPNTTNPVPVSLSFGLTREPLTDGNERFDGFLSIEVTAPSGLVSSTVIPVRDDR